ncbi:MAG: DUF973 family protein [Thermoplasmataceae archaeon]|jgi:hypothetical protein
MDQQKSYVPEGKPFKFCPNCGAKIDKDAVICPACGASQTGTSGFGSISNQQESTFTVSGRDLDGIKNVKTASLLGIIGIILGLVGAGAIEGAILSGIQSGSPFTAIPALFIVALIGIIIGFVSILLYRAGFRDLREVDGQFGTPYTFTTVLLVGFAVLILALLLVLGGVVALSLSLVLFGAVLVIIAAILLLLGDIVGIILGLWRVGVRYNNTLIKVGAIFYIIPYLDVLAPVLVFIGANSVEKKLETSHPPSDGTVM